MSRVYKNDANVKIRLDAREDISSANSVIIYYRKPDGTEGNWTATVEDSNYGYVTTGASDLDVAGKWDLQLYVSNLSGWKGHGEITHLDVWEPIYDEDSGVGYCSTDDVQRLIKRVTFGSNSKVTLEDVKDLIKDRFHIINSALYNAGVTVPIKSTAKVSFQLVKRLNAIGTAADVENIPTMVAEAKASRLGEYYETKFDNILQAYVNNPKMLYDAKQEECRLRSSTEDTTEGKIAFPSSKNEEFIEDHRLDYSGDYMIDGKIKAYRGP